MTQAAAIALREVKRVTILGATGSVGRNTLDLIARNRDSFYVEALTAHRDCEGLIALAKQIRPQLAVIGDGALYHQLSEGLAGTGIACAAGAEAIVAAAERPVDWIMAAIVGAAGLAATIAGVKQGAQIAIANKECLVCAGEYLTTLARECGATLLPVDSEHNAIFQVFDQQRPETVEQIILTASGGPFRTFSREQMRDVTPKQAVAHPNWDMGAKISVDSATCMNKGLELIEAFHLFPVTADQIDILIHPQSVVHSLVSYIDGSVLAQMGSPDMRTPIAYTLSWPARMVAPVSRLNLAEIAQLTFEAPDFSRFPALKLARDTLLQGGGAPAILNAANEMAVAGFLSGQIGFLTISDIVAATLEDREMVQWLRPHNDVEEIIAADQQARRVAKARLERAR